MKTKKEIFVSRVNFSGNHPSNLPDRCWEFVPKNQNYVGSHSLSFNLGNGKTKSISLCGFYFFTGKFPKGKIYSLCHNKLCVNPSHYTGDYCIAYFGEYYKDGVRYKPCPKCKKSFPKTKEYFYFMGNGTLTCCKQCAIVKVRESRAIHWARALRNEIFRRHNQTGIEVDIDENYIQELYNKQNGKCYWSGLTMVPSTISKYPFQPSVDRLDNSKGYLKDNVVLCCFSFNMGRNSISKELFEEFILAIKYNGISTENWK